MNRGSVLILIVVFIFVLFPVSVIAPPPTPHNVRGRVFNIDGTSGVSNGIPVKINNTNSGAIVLTYVYAPDIPSLKGSYSAVINGSDNDNIIVTAWNSSYYGTNTSTLASTTTNVNLVFDTIRPSETNTTILSLENHSLLNISEITQISAQITIIGGQNGVNCYAVLNMTNTSVLNLSQDTYSHYLGNIDLGSSTTTDWSVMGLGDGSTNISVNSYCASDGINFDGVNYDLVYNLTLIDRTSPIIGLISPENNSALSSNLVAFVYNVTDESEISNCSLVINNAVNQTNHTVEKGVNQYFYQNLLIGTYNWSVKCIDNSSNKIVGFSLTYNLSITENRAPIVKNIIMEDPIDLSAGSIRRVYCNATVRDEDNISDIKNVSSTFYHLLVESYSPDDNNNHYTNNSCEITDASEFERNYSCSFFVHYYSDQGIWSCNITSYDYSNSSGSARIDTNINELVALDVSSSIIDFGNLQVGNVSQQDVDLNITNVGNKDINITLAGFAAVEGDGLSMACEEGSISVGYERYSINEGNDYANMINLTSTPIQISNFTLPQRTNDTNYKNDRNHTYWKISVPYGPYGQCNGSVNFVAVPT